MTHILVSAAIERSELKSRCLLHTDVIDPPATRLLFVLLAPGFAPQTVSVPRILAILGAAATETCIILHRHSPAAPEHLPYLFERFHRAASARARATGGFGLGLAISQAIVHAHHGQIEITSEPDTGTTFTVILPVNPAVQGDEYPIEVG
jgi:phosphoglycerate-specific signal transduction histidine kinase